MEAKHILFFLLVLFIQTSCDKEKYYNLDHNNWFAFHENDTLLYRSVYSVDTFIINSIINDYSNIDKNYYFENLRIYYKKKNYKFDSISYTYAIERRYNAFLIHWKNLFSTIGYSKSKSQTFSIDGIIINNVYQVNTDTSNMELNETDIREVYYSDKFGVIAYTLANDTKFTLDTNFIK